MHETLATILPLAKVGEAILSLLALDPGMSLQAASALILIAKNQPADAPMTTAELAKLLKLSPTATSRMVYYLGEGIPANSIKGLGLVELKIDPADRRRRSVHLTKSGRKTIDSILKTIS